MAFIHNVTRFHPRILSPGRSINTNWHFYIGQEITKSVPAKYLHFSSGQVRKLQIHHFGRRMSSTMMKAIRVNQHGGASNLVVEDIAIPKPADGEVLIKNHAVGVNFIDIYFREGKYPMTPPFTIGNEGAGVIVSIGGRESQIKASDKDTRDTLRVGDRVAYVSRGSGSYAEYTSISAIHVVKIGGNEKGEETDLEEYATPYEVAAASLLQGMTAHYLVRSTFPVTSEHKVLIHAAAGGMGLLLSQLCRNAGALVIGTCSTEEKAEKAKAAGCHHVINYSKTPDFTQEVKRLTEGKGVNVVYDGVGKATFLGGLDCLVPRGMMVLFGGASGPVEPVNPLILSQKGSLFLTRPSLFDYTREREELVWRAREVFEWVSSGKLNIEIGKTFLLTEARQAHEALQGRATTGKVILTCEP